MRSGHLENLELELEGARATVVCKYDVLKWNLTGISIIL